LLGSGSGPGTSRPSERIALDALIAAHALALRVMLVTNNVSEFARVKGLKVENWV
jgi:predicted nucleic acid-binding protein